MRFFVHNLDGDVKDWFNDLLFRSIDGIAAMDDAFLRNWVNKKEILYYITEFREVKREEGEFVLDF
jgi:hypothetical protein